MKLPNRFLTAEWNNLVMLNYAVDPLLLERFVPPGTELDDFEGRTYLSLVGFEFNHTRIYGFPVPFHGSFEEVNLRFYVRRQGKRGVVFIRELVPKYAVAAIARFAFGENYSRVPMSHRIREHADGRIAAIEYSWGSAPDPVFDESMFDAACSIRMATDGDFFLPADGSLSQFISEHYWGYAKQPGGRCLEYEVQHPRWSVCAATPAGFSGNADAFYGSDFAPTLARDPDSAFLARGSAVTVFHGKKIAHNPA